MSFAIFTDSFSNLPGKVLSELNIFTMPCTYYRNGEPVQYNGDVDAFDSRAFYDGMRAGDIITTSLTNVQQFLDAFRPVVAAGQDVVYVGLSSAVSGTYQAAKMAAEDLEEEYPGRTLCAVDSLGASLGTGILACRAADLRAEGKTAKETAASLELEREYLCEFFTVENLTYLRRTGRVSAATAAIGNVLNIKPLLYGDDGGHIVSCAKCRGRKKAIDAIVEKYAQKAVDPQNRRVAISHGDCEAEAQALAERICAIAKPKELIICPHEPFSGSHVGPGMLALYFFGDSRL